MMTLYVYDHCPYCVKARMIFGLKSIPFELKMMANDDESTPVNLVGKKVVPILTKEDGSHMPESMDIVHYVDKSSLPLIVTGNAKPEISEWLKTINSYLNALLMPRYVKADLAEFKTPSARDYYQSKKEAVIGSFAQHFDNTNELLKKINHGLLALNSLIESDNACNGILSTDDFHLFAALRGLSIVKGIDYPDKVDAYRKKMAELSSINLFDDMAF